MQWKEEGYRALSYAQRPHTMFPTGYPKHRELSKHIAIKTISGARGSARWLTSRFEVAVNQGEHKKAVVIKKATVNASNIARASASRQMLPGATKYRLRRVSEIYRRAEEGMIL